MKKILLSSLMAAVLLMAGCSSPQYIIHYPAGKTHQDYAADRFECERKSEAARRGSALVSICLEAKGYRYVEK